MTAPATKFRGECPTSPAGLPASTQTAQTVASDGAAGREGEVSSGLATPAEVPAAPAVLGGHLFPVVLLVLLWSVFVGATCWGDGFEHGWDRAYPLGVEEGARGLSLDAYQRGREHEWKLCTGGGAS